MEHQHHSSTAAAPIGALVERARAARRLYETRPQAQAVAPAGRAIVEPARNPLAALGGRSGAASLLEPLPFRATHSTTPQSRRHT